MIYVCSNGQSIVLAEPPTFLFFHPVTNHTMTHTDTTNSTHTDDRHLARFHDTIHGLLDRVSHDFRTPLTVIKEYATLMQDELVGPVTPSQRDYLETINDRADDLTTIVDNLLDAGKSAAGVLRTWRRAMDVAQVIRAVEGPLRRKATAKGTTLEIAVEDDLTAVFADTDQLTRTVANLITGILNSLEQPKVVRLAVTAGRSPSRVAIEVAVEEADVAPKTFSAVTNLLDQSQPCDPTLAQGNLLRFAMVRRLVDLHLGQIDIKSEADRITFCLDLPIATPRAVLQAFVAHQATARAERSTVKLAVAAIGSGSKSAAFVVDEFLQTSLGEGDLAIQIDPEHWLLLLLEGECAANELLTQLEVSWTEISGDIQPNLLPAITWTDLGSHCLTNEVDRWTELIRSTDRAGLSLPTPTMSSCCQTSEMTVV